MAKYERQGESDEWYTPRYIFDAMGLHFDLDVSAPIGGPRYVPCSAWIDSRSDGLSAEWRGLVFMNPPFGHQKNKKKWLSRFFAHGQGVALLPDRTSAPWFQEFAPKADAVCFVSPKIKFERPDGSLGESPGTGTALLALGSKSVRALCESNLGLVVRTISTKQDLATSMTETGGNPNRLASDSEIKWFGPDGAPLKRKEAEWQGALAEQRGETQ